MLSSLLYFLFDLLYVLLVPRVYQKHTLYFHKVVVRLRTRHSPLDSTCGIYNRYVVVTKVLLNYLKAKNHFLKCNLSLSSEKYFASPHHTL